MLHNIQVASSRRLHLIIIVLLLLCWWSWWARQVAVPLHIARQMSHVRLAHAAPMALDTTGRARHSRWKVWGEEGRASLVPGARGRPRARTSSAAPSSSSNIFVTEHKLLGGGAGVDARTVPISLQGKHAARAALVGVICASLSGNIFGAQRVLFSAVKKVGDQLGVHRLSAGDDEG